MRNSDFEAFGDSSDESESLLAQLADAYSEAIGDQAQGRARPAFAEQFLGVIRTSPCGNSSATSYTDARYSIDRASPGDLGETDLVSAAADVIPGIRQCITATNLAEVAGNTHLLQPGTLVQVVGFYSRSSPPAKLYVFNAPPTPTVVVKLSGTAAGAGEYDGRILGGASSASPAGALTMPAGMTVPATDNALVLNTEEDGISGHRLQINSFAIGCVVGMTAEPQPRCIVMVRGGLGATASPSTLGDGTGGSLAADSSNWAKSSSGTPLNLWVQTRTFWDTSGNVLYAYLRQLSLDARGLLIAVSGETQVAVDTTESCP
jgi:hypothetical protein